MKELLAFIALFLVLAIACTQAEVTAQTSELVDPLVRPRTRSPNDTSDRNCSVEREAALHSGRADGHVPQCDADGSYRAMQSYSHPMAGIRSSWCVAKGGQRILPGSDFQACECVRERFEAQERNRKHIMGGFTPSCNDTTGHFSPQQLHSGTGYRWCADQTGKVIGEKTRGQLVGC